MIIEIDTQSPSPIYEQLRNQIVFGIAAKRLAPNEALPSVRRLAADLGINLHTVNKAYSLLFDEGYIVMDRRKGAMVAQGVRAKDAFAEKASGRLALCAAEAVCHGMGEAEFLGLCGACFKSARSDGPDGQPNGGKGGALSTYGPYGCGPALSDGQPNGGKGGAS